MQRFHFVHTSGLDLNAPFAGIGKVSDPVAGTLANAGADAWDDVVAFCIDKPAAFVVVSGGIEREGHDGLRGQLRFLSGLQRLSDAGVHALVALDRCDHRLRRLLEDDTPSKVTVFPTDQPVSVAVEVDGKTVAWVAGQSADDEQHTLALDQFFADVPETATNCTLVGVVPHDLAEVDEQLETAARKPSYWAVGHPATASRKGFSPWIVEAGSLQAKRATSEPTPHGAMHVEAEGASVVAARQVELDRVRYATVEITPTHGLDNALLSHQVTDELNRLRATHAGRGLIVDIVLNRSGVAIDDTATDAGDKLATLLSELREKTASWDPLVWCNRLTVATPQVDPPVTNLIEQAIVEQSRALLANPLQRSYFFANRFDRLMRCWTSELDNDETQELVTSASHLAVAQLGREESS